VQRAPGVAISVYETESSKSCAAAGNSKVNTLPPPGLSA
jgi:hypothetical protein